VIERIIADGDYRLNDKPAGFMPAALPAFADEADDSALLRKGVFTVLMSSVGNPDYGQSPDQDLPGVFRIRAKVDTMEEASVICQRYIGLHDLGSGNWSGGDIIENGQVVAKVSYNGRVRLR
jgi:hypothetical protein